ncbi:MAG: TRAP transporter small permease [Lachnospiraceae bacterium]|nr:TRAP transporter small permease [Lachnospiraceae bacterium]MDY4969900.1 TRAP transporter small permease [Lachnospiraceae bacterium]
MKVLHSIRNIIDKITITLCVCIFALMVVVGTYQIVTRYFFNSPSTVSEELLTYSFTWMALLASAYVFGKRDHMRMGFLADKLSGMPRKVLEIAIEGLVIILAGGIMVYGGFNIMDLTMTQVTASLGIPMGVVYTVLPLSGILIVIYSVLNIVDLVTGYENETNESAEVKE